MAKEPLDCRYLIDGRLCNAINEQSEGKDVRKRFCTNDPKDYCCYLCSSRKSCEVSCTYLDASHELSIDAHLSSEIEAQIKKYQKEVTKLSVLLADGKIGEKSFSAATGALERKIEELKKIKDNPSVSSSQDAPLQSGDFERLTDQEELGRPSSLWYLVPFFFGIIGGIVGYVGVKDEDRGMADLLLILGIVWTIMLVIAYLIILGAILSH
jgi:hypothetical protein